MKKVSFQNYKILTFFGVLFFLAAAGNNFKNNQEFVGANILLLGALACYLRKSNKWLWLEILSLLGLTYLIVLVLMSGGWYADPVSLLAPALASPTCYIYTLLKNKRQDKNIS